MAAMGSLFRSEEMSLIQLYIPLEIAQPTVAELGEVGLVEFRDLNPDVNAFQRAFVNEIRRLDEMERKLRFLQTQIEKATLPIRPFTGSMYYARSRTQQEIDELDERLVEHEARVLQMNNSLETLNKRYLELTELRHVLRETAIFFEEAESHTNDIIAGSTAEDAGLLAPGSTFVRDSTDDAIERGEPMIRTVNLGFVAGVIPRARMNTFERILWRALRGNLYMNYAEIDEPITDPITDEVVTKNVFIIFAHGKEILAKIRKICESLGATLYPVDDSSDKRRQDALEVIARIEDVKHVLDTTRNTRRTELSKVAESLEAWTTVVKKEKAIYYTMNMFNYDVNRKALIAEGWAPSANLTSIQYALRTVMERTSSTIPPLLNELRTTKTPPTFHRTNKFTVGFQELVDAYGIATYREVNPALFTIISFPFLFAIMFGDFGHGIIMLAFATWMVLYEKSLEKVKEEIFSMFFGGRYIILLMGCFSIYTGLVYNDAFSKPLDLFYTGYGFEKEPGIEKWIGFKRWTYAFGVDPAWATADNVLLFSNSYKMKMAVLLGVIHMTFGIILSAYNAKFFHRPLDLYGVVLPQIIFMMSIFGYLAFLIVFKWCNNWDGLPAPGLLNTLIYMFLSPGTVKPDDQLFPGQAGIQSLLVLLAMISIPWMLLVKPLTLRAEHNKVIAQGYANLDHTTGGVGERPSEDLPRNSSTTGSPHDTDTFHASPSGASNGGGAGHAEMHHEEVHAHGDQFEFGEVFIHQMIHTIEFCLGGISNTASYLRLWALSLAHAQLSEVLWEMVLANSFDLELPTFVWAIAIVVSFTIWFQMTIAILVLMEGLSAFLHALRLHWVEFQNKFYGGEGRKFDAFSFAKILAESNQ
ncbi:hypothetical protein SmJEL517_g03985 [Synchytrium microbalum]|uniref:V-type proton ATPase subunit a n=1 Tax=Synchytrium microbalum TaxID=1806994 RepID=A0A507C633_9FUNG|nr:uncharacterized protein SmJEL517_g03985 [Synchytrium microbalum]TPX33003.1 hypothetical protein SmJEL517_g03985 [Synchytrium microbalum]